MEDDLLVLIQDTEMGDKIAYVPYGPTIKPSDENKGVFLEELSESLRSYLPTDCVLMRYDLLWESPWAKEASFFDEQGNWVGPPAKENQEIRLNFDTHYWNLKKTNTNLLPSDTLFIDLKKDDDRLLGDMKPKTRYNTRLSFRKGVQVRQAGLDEIGVWYDLYQDTCRRNGMPLHELELFKAVVKAKHSDVSLKGDVQLLIAEIDKKPLAAMFLAYSHRRATYLYGASSSKDRQFMAPYALQWEAMQRAKQKGCTEYDMFGVSPAPDPSHPLYGLYRFKTGFGGTLYHRMGCWDYLLKAD